MNSMDFYNSTSYLLLFFTHPKQSNYAWSLYWRIPSIYKSKRNRDIIEISHQQAVSWGMHRQSHIRVKVVLFMHFYDGRDEHVQSGNIG